MHMGINSGKNQNKETVLSLKKMLKKKSCGLYKLKDTQPKAIYEPCLDSFFYSALINFVAG